MQFYWKENNVYYFFQFSVTIWRKLWFNDIVIHPLIITTMTNTTFETIEKEKIEALKFPAQEVLIDKEQIKERESELNRALALGNLEHTKIKIYFEDDQSRKLVETTVWGVTDKRVILKQGVVIPINRVHKISLQGHLQKKPAVFRQRAFLLSKNYFTFPSKVTCPVLYRFSPDMAVTSSLNMYTPCSQILPLQVPSQPTVCPSSLNN